MLPISFEFFPPKTDEQREQLEGALPKLKAWKPEYASCTFGAGGSTLSYTPETIERLRRHGLEAAPHLSCVGSTRAGIDVARNAAATVKKVAQELGGKSANILLDDADLATFVPAGVQACFMNSGQACAAPTRMLVPQHLHDEAVRLAKASAEGTTVGDQLQPRERDTDGGDTHGQVERADGVKPHRDPAADGASTRRRP